MSKQILELTDPVMLTFVVPWKTEGDGNCLFRSAAIAAYDDETKHEELRQLVSEEIKQNPRWYNKDDPNYCSPFAKDQGILLQDYCHYIENTHKLGEWSDINHILALSAVLETPIQSYFPFIPSAEANPFSRTIIGRTVTDHKHPRMNICIMWTSAVAPSDINDFQPNHFVPLMAPLTGNFPNVYFYLNLIRLEYTF